MNTTGPKTRKDEPRKHEAAPPRIRLARAGFTDLVLVCSKCAKRQGLKKGAVRALLKRTLKRMPDAPRTRVVEVGCLGPCPKRALAVATSASLAARRIHLLDPASPPDAAVAALFPDRGPKPFREAGPVTASERSEPDA